MRPVEVVIGGLPIPDARPVFLAVLAVHVVAGMLCVIAGAIAASARKRPGVHPRAGRAYVLAFALAFVSLATLAVLRWPHDNVLLVIGIVTLAAATVGVVARRRAGPGWRLVHGTAMGLSYIGLLTGFYVDNGPHLPLWRELPAPLLWVLPTVIGVPILVLALRRDSSGPGHPGRTRPASTGTYDPHREEAR